MGGENAGAVGPPPCEAKDAGRAGIADGGRAPSARKVFPGRDAASSLAATAIFAVGHGQPKVNQLSPCLRAHAENCGGRDEIGGGRSGGGGNYFVAGGRATVITRRGRCRRRVVTTGSRKRPI